MFRVCYVGRRREILGGKITAGVTEIRPGSEARGLPSLRVRRRLGLLFWVPKYVRNITLARTLSHDIQRRRAGPDAKYND